MKYLETHPRIAAAIGFGIIGFCMVVAFAWWAMTSVS